MAGEALNTVVVPVVVEAVVLGGVVETVVPVPAVDVTGGRVV